MSRILHVLIVTCLLCSGVVFAQNGSDFAGTWVMDTARSDSANLNSPRPVHKSTQIITAQGDELRIETIRDDDRQVAYFPVSDESRLENPGPKPVGTSGRAGFGSIDKIGFSLLNTTTPLLINNKAVTVIEKRQLSSDGKEMTVETTIAVQHGYDGPGLNFSPIPVRDVVRPIRPVG